MSGSRPPGWDPDEPDHADPTSHEPDSGGAPDRDLESNAAADVEGEPEPFEDSAELAAADRADETDAYSRAYSAPESEHFTSGPYMPADLRLYDYDEFDELSDADDEHRTARWPWVVGVAAIVAAIALVVSVSLLFARTDTTKLANPGTTTAASTPPMQDEITTTKPPPPPPPPPPLVWSPQTPDPQPWEAPPPQDPRLPLPPLPPSGR